MAGYHLRQIARGVFGEASKIREEAEEFAESLEQGNPIMALVELSDLLGAMRGWLAKHHPSMTILDLIAMSDATERAFANGGRVNPDAPTCSHEHVGKSDVRMPLAFGSAEVQICTDCWSWRFNLHGWSGWKKPEEMPEAMLEDTER